MISTPIRRYGAAILMLLICTFSGGVFAKTHHGNKASKSLGNKDKFLVRPAVSKSILAIV
ncbi:Uncharacterised protein [Kluyvera cryocrescens]|uniref:Uncharacterized protein n=1 Tax=Kluyvera cryocrescens TaxID=580 RepID=A0A485AJA1_KLUCR|nr:Uncharacterised protein [Kluyvera cryocrescens]